MVKLFRMLGVVMVAVHLTMGCSWHHAHGCEDHGGSTLAHNGLPDGRCGDDDGSPSDHGSHDCKRSACSFVSPSRSVMSALDLPVRLVLAASLDVGPSCESIRSSQCFVTAGRLLMPVRLHLANQVQLI
jgi:hypothetical protein